MMFQESFKKIGLAKLEKEECKKYLHKILKSPWLEIGEESVDICIDAIPQHVEHYQKHFKVTKDQCDGKYNCFTDCIDLALFTVRKYEFKE
jgi:hypothetical protein